MSLGCRTRFASLFALEYSLNSVGATRDDPRVDTLAREIETKAAPGTTVPPLDQHVRTIVNHALEWVRTSHGNQIGGRYDDAVAALTRSVEALACAGCSTLGVCRGSTVVDAPIVAQGGRCIEILKNIFDAVLQVCVNTYSSRAKLLGAAPGAGLDTAGSHYDEVPVDYLATIHGLTNFDDEGRGFSARVQITLPMKGFCWDALGGVYYVVMHEVLCHVFQNIVGNPRGHREAMLTGFDSLAEGWIDRLADKLLDELADPARPAVTVGTVPLSQLLGPAKRLYQHRGAKANVKLGRLVADEVERLLHRLAPDPAAAKELFWQLSLDWNLIDWSLERRALVVRALDDNLCRPGPQRGEIILAFSHFVLSRNAPILLENINKLVL